MCLFFFFFKQKTAYEMRISDWSSDVCSSDLAEPVAQPFDQAPRDKHRSFERIASDIALLHQHRREQAVRRRRPRRAAGRENEGTGAEGRLGDRKSTRLNSSH